MSQIHHNSKKLFRLTPLIMASVLTVGMVMTPFSQAHADQYDDQISVLKSQISANQQKVDNLQDKAGDLQSQIDKYINKIAALQAQINTNQSKIESLNSQIAQAKKDLAAQKDMLAAILQDVSTSQLQTPLEALVSSKNFGDFFDAQENQARITDQINNSINKITDLQTKLNKQKQATELLMEQQQQNRQELASAKAAVDSKLESNKSKQRAFNKKVGEASAAINQLRAAQAQMYANLVDSSGQLASSGGYGSFQYRNYTGETFCGGGYPSNWCGAAQDSLVDKWQLYNRECVSYAAWRMSLRHNVSGFNGAGNAYQFPYTAQSNGDAIVNSTPAVGSVVMIPPAMIGGVGHVAVVESVNGGWIHVSQYNWAVTGTYSEMDIKLVPGLVFAHFR